MSNFVKIFAVATLMSIGFSSQTMTNPSDFEKAGMKEVNTSGTDKAWVGEWQDNDTVIVDSLGHKSTLGELKKATSLVQ